MAAVQGEGLRNTPAYAGKTRASADDLHLERKHPRLRGEDGIANFLAAGA